MTAEQEKRLRAALKDMSEDELGKLERYAIQLRDSARAKRHYQRNPISDEQNHLVRWDKVKD